MRKKDVFIYLLIIGFFYICFFGFVTKKVAERKFNQDDQSTSEIQSFVNKVINKLHHEKESTHEIELVLVGDIMLGRTVMGRTYEVGDSSYPFRKVFDYLDNADTVFANLENPIINDCPFTEKSLIFCSTPEMLEGLLLSEINVVNLANNHTGNYGNKGINETIEYLNGTDIDYTGKGELLIKEINGIGLGFLGFNYTFGESEENIQRDLELIETSDPKVDYLIIGVHWGQEYKSESNSFQKEMARKMVTAGADVISGHHPHWIQESDVIDGKLVYYSLGNFVFDQMWSEKTRTGLVIKLLIDEKGIREIEKKQVYMSNWAQPEFEE